MTAQTLATIIIGLTIAIAVLGCVRVIGYEYYNAVLWHNLKIQVHRLRIDQQTRLQQVLEAEGSVDIVPDIVPEDAAVAEPEPVAKAA